MSLSDRFWAKVSILGANDCWEWQASLGRAGYGQIRVGDRPDYAHRVAVRLDGRLIPAGAHVHHQCGNRRCVNPAHLEVVRDQAEHSERHHRNCSKHGDEDMRRVKSGKNLGMRYCGVCNRERPQRRADAA